MLRIILVTKFDILTMNRARGVRRQKVALDIRRVSNANRL